MRNVQNRMGNTYVRNRKVSGTISRRVADLLIPTLPSLSSHLTQRSHILTAAMDTSTTLQ